MGEKLGKAKETVVVLFPGLRSARTALVNTSERLRGRARHVEICSHVELDHSELGEYVYLAHHSQVGDSLIGKRTSVGRYSKIRGARIGKYCSISWNVTIGAAQHYMGNLSSHQFWHLPRFGVVGECEQPSVFVETVLGNDVWVGCDSVIRSGVSVGDGAVIGSNSVVTKDVPPYAIVAGSPARVLKYRFDEETVGLLEELQWWDWDDDTLRKHIDLFSHDLNKSEIASLLGFSSDVMELNE